jgi:hypothetical protein
VTPLIPIAIGLATLLVGVLILRTYGARYRVGRLLAAARVVSVSEARTLAHGPERYVRVDGRIDAEEEFEDDAHQPLVFRRTRLQLLRDGDWVTFEDDRQRVRFQVRDGLEGIVVDDVAFGDGLIVIPRESIGTAADLPDRIPTGTPLTTSVRLRVEQISSVEHAIVVGVPGLDEAGEPRMSAGLGRPLILTTLDRDEAMRILVSGERRRSRIAVLCFATGAVLMAIGLILSVSGALA